MIKKGPEKQNQGRARANPVVSHTEPASSRRLNASREETKANDASETPRPGKSSLLRDIQVIIYFPIILSLFSILSFFIIKQDPCLLMCFLDRQDDLTATILGGLVLAYTGWSISYLVWPRESVLCPKPFVGLAILGAAFGIVCGGVCVWKCITPNRMMNCRCDRVPVIPATFHLDPPSSLVDKGRVESLSVMVSDLSELLSADVRLYFDPKQVMIVDKDTGQRSKKARPGDEPFSEPFINAVARNYVEFLVKRSSAYKPDQLRACVVFSINFEIIDEGPGEFRLEIRSLEGESGSITAIVPSDPSLFTVVAPPPTPTVAPSQLISPTQPIKATPEEKATATVDQSGTTEKETTTAPVETTPAPPKATAPPSPAKTVVVTVTPIPPAPTPMPLFEAPRLWAPEAGKSVKKEEADFRFLSNETPDNSAGYCFALHIVPANPNQWDHKTSILFLFPTEELQDGYEDEYKEWLAKAYLDAEQEVSFSWRVYIVRKRNGPLPQFDVSKRYYGVEGNLDDYEIVSEKPDPRSSSISGKSAKSSNAPASPTPDDRS